MAEVERSCVKAEGPDDAALAKAVQWALTAAHSRKSDIVIVTPAKQNAENLARVLGARATAALLKGQPLEINGVNVTLATVRKDLHRVAGRVVVAVWVDDEILAKLDDGRPVAICHVPWMPDDGKAWRKTWSPVDLETGVRTAAAPPLPPLVRAGLKSLTNSVNLSTGLGHPSDRDAAIETLRLLKGAGERLDPDAIRAWAANSGWAARGADDLAEIARGVVAGKAFRTSGLKQYNEHVLDLWRQDAAREQDDEG